MQHAIHQWQQDGPAERRAETSGLRIDALPGRWSHPASTRPGAFLQITDRRTEAVIADLRCAQTSEVLPEPEPSDQRIRIRFGLAGSDQILMIAPGEARCRLAGGDWQGLPALQSLVDAALAEMRAMDPASGPRSRVHSPDGRIRIDYHEYEHRNNEWLPTPEIVDLDSGTVILKHDTWISKAHHEWGSDGRFMLIIANYAMPELMVRFDMDAGTVRLQDDEEQPIREAGALIHRWLRAQDRQIEWPSPPPGRSTREALLDYVRGYDWRPGAIALLFAAPFMLWLAWYGGWL